MEKELEFSLNHVPRIAILEERLIDQIKAGEVMESPANMAKELIENSLDAKSSKIILKVHNNPMEYFSIQDNGHGIHPEDLPLVFARHATSKIHSYQDLCDLSSYGFRGEALASLGSISKVLITTSLGKHRPTMLLEHECGNNKTIHVQSQNSLTSGTEIIVTELFKSTPARFKFIQKKLAELQKFKKIINSYLIAYPEIEWDVHFDKDFQRYKSESEVIRIQKIFGQELIYKELLYKNIKMKIWIDLSPEKKKNNLKQFIFVNNRPVQFSTIHAIIVKQLGYSPSYAIFIDIEQSNIDINIHPAKTEVKFFDKASILSMLTTILKSLANNNSQKLNNHHTYIESLPAQEENSMTSQAGALFLKTENPNFVITTNDNIAKYILNLKRLYNFVLLSSVQKGIDESVPLLVGMSFMGDKNIFNLDYIKEWNKSGLTLNFNKSENLWYVETVPIYWPLLNYSYLIDQILTHKILPENLSSNEIDAKKVIPVSNLDSILHEINEETLLNEKIIQSIEVLLKNE